MLNSFFVLLDVTIQSYFFFPCSYCGIFQFLGTLRLKRRKAIIVERVRILNGLEEEGNLTRKKREDTSLRQTVKATWAKDGYDNTFFFHNWAKGEEQEHG